MKIQAKTFLKFQIAAAIVTAILMPLYWYVICIAIGEPASALYDSLIIAIIPTIIFAIILFPVWKLWKGKTWYSLSLLFFSAVTVVAVIHDVISFVDTSELGFTLFWGATLFYVMFAPVNLIIACLIGLIGKYFSTKHHSGI